MRLVFAGTPSAAVPSLRALLASPRHEVVAVLTRPAAASGRGRKEQLSPVEQLAREADVAVLTPSRPADPDFIAQLRELAPDCCPVVAYGALLPATALEVPERGWVNLHFSLLPAWRGAAPVQRAILAGDEVTGASTFQLEVGMDTGPVYGVITETITPTDTAGDLLERLAVAGARLLLATVDGIEDGTLIARPQPADGVSLAPKIAVADAQVSWTVAAYAIDRLVRACTPAPGAWTQFRGERLKLGPVRPIGPISLSSTGSPSGSGARPTELAPGELMIDRDAVRVGAVAGTVQLGDVQPPGKRMMPALDWARGARIQPGERLG